MAGVEYGPLARLFHQLALGTPGVPELCAELDQWLGKPRTDLLPHGPPVFVTGLARGGTTVVMQTLHDTGAFRSLTYRDMPFVMMPRLWMSLSRRFQVRALAAERAHGDGLMHGFDTAEALDEVFWLTAARDLYVRPDRLLAHRPGAELLTAYGAYIARVLDAQPDDQPAARRYLAKNNNHLLRLSSLPRVQGQVVLCFRAPLDHAASLLHQHQRFSAQQAGDAFARRYMGWLGHHEFGLDHRPHSLGRDLGALSGRDPLTLDYWLAYWLDVHQHLLDQHQAGLLWLCHETLCSAPQRTLASLLSALHVQADAQALAKRFKPAHQHVRSDVDSGLLRAADEVYARLQQQALGASQPADIA